MHRRQSRVRDTGSSVNICLNVVDEMVFFFNYFIENVHCTLDKVYVLFPRLFLFVCLFSWKYVLAGKLQSVDLL